MNPVNHQPPPELRRTKSLSASKNTELGFVSGGLVLQPQRKSCDVRRPITSNGDGNMTGDRTVQSSGAGFETNEEEEEDNVNDFKNERDEIRVSEEEGIRNLNDLDHEIEEMEAKIDAIIDNLKSINNQMDLNAHSKKPSLSNLWPSASVWSTKLQNWKRKLTKNVVNRNGVVSKLALPPGKTVSRRCCETQSEIADYGFGRRSCDLGPRFSLDASRVSFDEPRGSWDGYVVGRSFPKLPPMVGDGSAVKILRSDVQIPGESVQTREYYMNSSSRRMNGVDRCERWNSVPTMVDQVGDDQNGSVMVSNSKVSPASIGYDRGLRFRSVGSEKELGRGEGDGDGDGLELVDKEVKKQKWWNRKLWWFVGGRAANGSSEDGELRSGFERKVRRSNSIGSWRKPKSSETGEKVYEGRDERVYDNAANHANNGLLRFYLTPLRGSRRSRTGLGIWKLKK